MDKTTRLQLNLPGAADYADIAKLNENFLALDGAALVDPETGQLPPAQVPVTPVDEQLADAAVKAAPADGDGLALADSADGKLKRLLWGRLLELLGAEFAAKSADGTYTPAAHAASHGKAGADALAPGDIGAAPGGYGLGAYGPEVGDFNSARLCGWYRGGGSAVNGPDFPYSSYGVVMVVSGGSVVYQHYYMQSRKGAIVPLTMAVRQSEDGGASWTEWEYINPPLSPGVEYRTTERYLGRPVYVQAVNFGAMPNNTMKTVTFGDATVKAITAFGTMSSGQTIPGCTGSDGFPTQEMQINTINGGVVGIVTRTDRSAFTAIVVVKYWKTTD